MRGLVLCILGWVLLVVAIDQGTNVEFGAWYWSVLGGVGFALAVLGITDS